MPVRAACLIVDPLLSMDDAHAMVPGNDSTSSLVHEAEVSDCCKDDITWYPDRDDADDLNFAAMPPDSHINVLASLCREFQAICQISISFHQPYRPKHANGIFTMA